MALATPPPLPQLRGDLMLDVFNHRSLSQGHLNDLHGNSDRLAQIGQSVLDTIVTFILIAERPMLYGDEFKARHEHALSDQSIVYWVNAYDTDLKKRVRVLSRDILDDPKEARFLFNSYVGAVCFQDGLQATANWISKLVKPDDEPVLMENLSSRPTTSAPGFAHGPAHTQAGTLHASANANAAAPPPYYVSPPQLPTPPPGVPQGTLAIFNQTCSKLGFNVGWESNSHGPQHDPRWEVKCLVNGVQRGIGVGRNQKMSKELAAREAWQYMTSVNWTLQQPEA